MTKPFWSELGMTCPIIQAPMGGGPTTPQLVAAVSDAGGLGSIAAGYLNADQLRVEIDEVRRRTRRPFAVNLFAPLPEPAIDDQQRDDVLRILAPLREELGLPPHPATATASPRTFEDQVDLLLEAPPAVVSFTFGALPDDAVASLRDAGCLLAGTATTVPEAQHLAARGCDLVVAQGAEAGAHRGSFLPEAMDAQIGTLVLVPRIVDSIDLPVIAAGGIMDGRQVAAVLTLGASAAQLGTAFLRCPEAGTAAAHRRALAEADEADTAITATITGRPARTVWNRLAEALDGVPVPAYPAMHALSAELRRAAAEQQRADLCALWAGQGVAMGTDLPARDVVRRIDEDYRATLRATAEETP